MKPGQKTVNVHEAKTHFSKLLKRVEAGNEVIIAKAGKPVARLIPFIPSGKRPLGMDAGLFEIPADFDDPLRPDVLADFEADFDK